MELIKIIYDKKIWIQYYEEELMLPNLPENGVWSAEGLPIVIYVKDETIMGKFGRLGDNSILAWIGSDCHLYLLFSELLESIAFLLSKGDEKYLIHGNNKEEHKEMILRKIKRFNFNVKNIDLAIYCTLGAMYSRYIFELDDERDELIIHYYNSLMEKCGEVRVPFKPFIKEVFNKYIDEFLEIKKMYGSKESYQMLINLINDIKRFYKERYGEELEFKIPI